MLESMTDTNFKLVNFRYCVQHGRRQNRLSEQFRRRITLDFDSSQPSEYSGLYINLPRAPNTPDCGVRKSSMVIASPTCTCTCYRRKETISCFDWCYLRGVYICGRLFRIPAHAELFGLFHLFILFLEEFDYTA